MLHRGLLPNVITYNALVSACEKGTLQYWALQMHQKKCVAAFALEAVHSWRQCCTKVSCQT